MSTILNQSRTSLTAAATTRSISTFIGTDPFSAAEQCRYVQNAGQTFVQINEDADLAAESVIELDGLVDLSAADFLFVF